MIPIVPFDNIIDRKSQGFNILLKYISKASILLRLPNLTYTSSLLGVGKTFIVKAILEYFKLPLYSV